MAPNILMSTLKSCWIFLLGFTVAIILQIFFFSPISPTTLELPSASSLSSFPPNNRLQRVVKLGEGFLEKPEDVAVDVENGVMYTATRDGWIKRLHRNGSWENWKRLGGDALLGITVAKNGGIFVCDAEKGLLKVTEDGTSILASHINGAKINFADDVIEGSDGTIYFSDGSSKFKLHEWHLDVLEAKPHGQLLKYDPSTKETSILLDNLAFANGVALSKDEEFLVICETWKFRCLKYWLKGEKEGETEIFVENLPNVPDNINLAPDGSFWIALVKTIDYRWRFVHSSNAAKHVIAAFPKLLKVVSGHLKGAMVINVAADGSVIRWLDDSNGTVMSFVTSALEFEDHLYLGSLSTNFVGKVSLK